MLQFGNLKERLGLADWRLVTKVEAEQLFFFGPTAAINNDLAIQSSILSIWGFLSIFSSYTAEDMFRRLGVIWTFRHISIKLTNTLTQSLDHNTMRRGN